MDATMIVTCTAVFLPQWEGVLEERAPGKMKADMIEGAECWLEWLFRKQQDDRKPFPWLPSMTSGDVVLLGEPGVGWTPWYCAGCGWLKLSHEQFARWTMAHPRDRGFGGLWDIPADGRTSEVGRVEAERQAASAKCV